LGNLILLHGWRCDASIWFSVAEQLTQAGYRVIAVDLPGFGKSQLPPESFTLQDYALTFAQFSAELELGSSVLIGHSFGARVAVKVALTKPEKVSSLILVSSGGWRPGYRLGLQFVAKLLKPIFSLAFLRDLRRKIYQLLGADDYLAKPELKKIFLNIINEDLLAAASAVRQPTLIIWGEKDDTAPIGFARQLQAQIPSAQLRVFPGAGHFVFLDKPQEFIRQVIEFCKEKP